MHRRDFIRQGSLYVLGAAIVEPYVRKWWPVSAVPWRESDADRLERLFNSGVLVHNQTFRLDRDIVLDPSRSGRLWNCSLDGSLAVNRHGHSPIIYLHSPNEPPAAFENISLHGFTLDRSYSPLV